MNMKFLDELYAKLEQINSEMIIKYPGYENELFKIISSQFKNSKLWWKSHN